MKYPRPLSNHLKRQEEPAEMPKRQKAKYQVIDRVEMYHRVVVDEFGILYRHNENDRSGPNRGYEFKKMDDLGDTWMSLNNRAVAIEVSQVLATERRNY